MKKQVCLIIAVFCCLNMQAQYEQQWGMEYPWNESLKIVSAVLYGDGYALTGTFSDTLVLGTDTLCSNGMEDVFLLLLSSEGKVANAFSYGDSGVDVPTGICNDNGRLFLIGYSQNGKDCSMFVLSLGVDAAWFIPFVFPFNGQLHPDFIQTNENSIIVGGSIKGRLRTGLQTIESETIESSFFLVLSKDGKVLSGWVVAGNCPNRARSFILEDNGERILLFNTGIGSVEFSDSTTLAMEKNGIIVLKLDSNWNRLWAQKATGSGFVEATSIAMDSMGYSLSINYEGKVSLGGKTFSSGGVLSSLLVHYDNAGCVQWIKEIDSDEHCRIINVGAVEGTVFCTGYYYGNLWVEGDTIHRSRERSSFLASFDLKGNFVWGCGVDFDKPNAGCGVVCDTSSVLLNGAVTSNESTAYSNRYTVKKGLKDPAVDTLEFRGRGVMAMGASKERIIENTLTFVLFPNPAQEKIYWTSDHIDDWNLYLIDERGVVVQKIKATKVSSGCVDLTRLSPGFYFLSIISKNKHFSHGFTKY